ncbi:BON domain-containing protein [Massilia sp. IC2-278]|jgi:osmotically-inducible protein OsmY|uniref:BON domain-containing protein n=1 Tax=Massilia sp. IC2-278 TaxID=2887200 RepID=UPI000E7D2921|nr:BON domain-containing protein [Massilia sp. IC2-278]MCC2963193.1 BON domain-containing protein [Massilia sp. IC2-278]HBI70584.1 transporter [Massilia sp.]
MKITQRLATAVFTGALAFTMVGCASGPQKESAGEYVDDSVITAKVKAAFAADSNVKATEINVETFKGDVQLSGFVSDAGDAQKAVAIARGVKGVSSVKNDIRVK